MVSESGTPDPDLNQPEYDAPVLRHAMPPPGHAYMRGRMEEEGPTFQYFQAIRLLERLAPDRAPVGQYAPPSQEVARFKVNQQLGFPDLQAVDVQQRPGRPLQAHALQFQQRGHRFLCWT